MQGLWKEQLGGWNHKDTKRKSQSRKNTLKDKFRALVNAEKRGATVPLKEEGSVETIKEYTCQKVVWIETYKIQIRRYIKSVYNGDYMEDIYSTSVRTAYKWKGQWYDDFSYKHIDTRGATIKKLSFLYKVEEELEEPIKRTIYGNNWFSGDEKSITFAYGKPVVRRYKYWNDGKRRKIAQKIASNSDRQILRTWIIKAEWDNEIKTHCLSKSIKWMIN